MHHLSLVSLKTANNQLTSSSTGTLGWIITLHRTSNVLQSQQLCSFLVLYNKLDPAWLQVTAAAARESPRCWSEAALQKTWQGQGTYQEKSSHDCPERFTHLGSPEFLGPQPGWCFLRLGLNFSPFPSPGVYTSCLLPAASPRFPAVCAAAGPAGGLQSSLSYTHRANTFMKHCSFTR